MPKPEILSLMEELSIEVQELREYEVYLFRKAYDVHAKIEVICGLMKGLRKPRRKK